MRLNFAKPDFAPVRRFAGAPPEDARSGFQARTGIAATCGGVLNASDPFSKTSHKPVFPEVAHG